MFINISLLLQSLPDLIQGAKITLFIAGFSGFIGLSFGTILGLLHRSTHASIRILVTLYVTIIRGTPMLVHILFAIYVLPKIGIHLPLLWSAIAAIGLNSAAYISQSIKAGISSINVGQQEAATVLGFSKFQTLRYIIFPQAFRIMLPALGNEFITLVKDSSLASTAGIMELTKSGQIIVSRTCDALTIFTGVALVYLIITSLLSLGVYLLEKKLDINASPQ